MLRLTARYEADELYQEALKAYDKKNVEEAILKLEQAIELLPRNSEYRAARGFMYLENGGAEASDAVNRKKALDDFDAALAIHDFEMLAHYGKGIIAYNDKNWDEALAHFTDAFYSEPERPETLYYLALVHHRKNDHRSALNWMKQAESGFERTNDRRKNDAGRWIRELDKLANARK